MLQPKYMISITCAVCRAKLCEQHTLRVGLPSTRQDGRLCFETRWQTVEFISRRCIRWDASWVLPIMSGTLWLCSLLCLYCTAPNSVSRCVRLWQQQCTDNNKGIAQSYIQLVGLRSTHNITTVNCVIIPCHANWWCWGSLKGKGSHTEVNV